MASRSSRPKPQSIPLSLEGIQQNQRVWLVKLPKYLSQQWSEASGSGEVGKLQIAKNQGKSEISFILNKELIDIRGTDGQPAPVVAPREHQLVLQGVRGQVLTALTERAPDQLSLEGTVVHRGECRPALSENYMRLKRRQIEESSKPARTVQKLEKVVTTNYKPVANHQYNIEYEKKKKENGKRVKADKDQVLTLLFAAFEKHQYYNIKDLVGITMQPVVYLKEILNEIGVRNVKGPHKNTWELKAEYRYYLAAAKKYIYRDRERKPASHLGIGPLFFLSKVSPDPSLAEERPQPQQLQNNFLLQTPVSASSFGRKPQVTGTIAHLLPPRPTQLLFQGDLTSCRQQ
ncbi:hypothetical protein E2I00_020026 [Balaenoptera physalus]|uniref:General transcription factor IIF subunit 2 n=1 Tax=Balaenoptera physalus TaxID=9770 RepID=A0A6A1Q4Y2_BALPH|nr:hypothetical protein E2I00_020026 [Balaenoptera physalus]